MDLYITSCWNCRGAYPMHSDRCTHCQAVNANVGLYKAEEEAARRFPKTPQTPVVQIYCRDGEFDIVVGESITDRLCFDEMLGQVVALTIPMCGTLASRVASGQPLFRMYTPEDLVARAEKHNAAMARNATLRTAEDEQRQSDRVDAARYRKLCELVGDGPWDLSVRSAARLTQHLDDELKPDVPRFARGIAGSAAITAEDLPF